jgi:ferrous iron transport protein B
VAVLSGISAKEIVVSTLGVLYSVEDADSDSASLSAKLLASGNYSRAGALAMIIFILLYLPCLATVMAIAHEAGGWKWAILSAVYNTLLAWVMAFVAFNVGVCYNKVNKSKEGIVYEADTLISKGSSFTLV